MTFAVASAPHRVGAPLRAPFAGHWRARRGEYRIRYRIDETQETVVVLDVEPGGTPTAPEDDDVAPSRRHLLPMGVPWGYAQGERLPAR